MAYLNLLSDLKDDIAAESLDLGKLSDKVRKLRNLSATDEKVHKSLGSSSQFLQDIRKLLERLLEAPSSEDQIVCLRLCAQFIGNLTVGNPINQRHVHTHCFEVVKKLMIMGDGKLSLYCSMLLYNSLLGSPEIRDDILADPNIIKEILKEESEFASFIYEELLLKHGELEKLYEYANNDQRLMLLSTVKDNKNKETLKEDAIRFIIERFKRQSDKILKIVTEYLHDIQPLEICLMLETLASLSGEPQYLTILQSDKSLFINCAFLLRSVHETGKAGDNCFTSVQRLTAGLPDEKLKDDPAFAFKVDLIRLLGNLCWKNKELQDQIRELECIPILLECCNIDEKNPFITQWSVLAIRNICEKNQENQSIIAGLSQKGVVSSPVLTELGYTLHSEEGKDIKLIPIQR